MCGEYGRENFENGGDSAIIVVIWRKGRNLGLRT